MMEEENQKIWKSIWVDQELWKRISKDRIDLDKKSNKEVIEYLYSQVKVLEEKLKQKEKINKIFGEELTKEDGK